MLTHAYRYRMNSKSHLRMNPKSHRMNPKSHRMNPKSHLRMNPKRHRMNPKRHRMNPKSHRMNPKSHLRMNPKSHLRMNPKSHRMNPKSHLRCFYCSASSYKGCHSSLLTRGATLKSDSKHSNKHDTYVCNITLRGTETRPAELKPPTAGQRLGADTRVSRRTAFTPVLRGWEWSQLPLREAPQARDACVLLLTIHSPKKRTVQVYVFLSPLPGNKSHARTWLRILRAFLS